MTPTNEQIRKLANVIRKSTDLQGSRGQTDLESDGQTNAKAVCDKTAYKLHDDFTRLNFPNLWHNGSHIGDDFSEYKPLRSAIDAKLQVICQSLAQGNSIKVKNKKMSKKPFAAGRGGGR
ncbi:Ethylene-responsive transcription factor RAP2-4 [Sarracenia purpurea var. burkii]